jgi:hypothetical protein
MSHPVNTNIAEHMAESVDLVAGQMAMITRSIMGEDEAMERKDRVEEDRRVANENNYYGQDR